MKVTKKQYYCPVCNNKEMHETNHFEEIYCNCNSCGNSPLYYGDAELYEAAHKDTPFIQATLNYYYFNLEDASENAAYYNLVRKLNQEMGYSVFTSRTPYHGTRSDMRFKAFRQYDVKVGGFVPFEVKLYNPTQFDNQYVSNRGRLFNWKEAIHENVYIKEGYYLVFSAIKPTADFSIRPTDKTVTTTCPFCEAGIPVKVIQ